MEDGTQKIAKMVEGSGVYPCHIHKYITDDLNEFNMHLKTEVHAYDIGSHGVCIICKADVDLGNYPVGVNPVCPDCEGRLLKSQEQARARMQANKGVKSK